MCIVEIIGQAAVTGKKLLTILSLPYLATRFSNTKDCKLKHPRSKTILCWYCGRSGDLQKEYKFDSATIATGSFKIQIAWKVFVVAIFSPEETSGIGKT